MRAQKTITFNEKRITIIINSRSRVGNFTGYSATIRDSDGHLLKIKCINKLYKQDAMDIAFVKFIKTFY